MMNATPPPPRLRADLPYRRIAVVLSGGGAMGAYEVGVLRVMEQVGLKPSILAGVSVGAVNAVLWLAHGFRTEALQRVWRALRPSTIGLLWFTLLLRTTGVILAVLAGFEMLLTLASSHELSLSRVFWHQANDEAQVSAVLMDAVAWGLVSIAGICVVALSDRADEYVARMNAASPDPAKRHRRLGRFLILWAALHVVMWVNGWVWPYRFSATVLVVGGLFWMSGRPGQSSDWIRQVSMKLSPETGGRGLWGGAPRRQLLRRFVAKGRPRLLTDGKVHVIISACDLGTGRMCYFVNWPADSPEFRERIQRALGDIVEVHRPRDIIEAAVASSAIPGLFKPVRFRGRDLIDGGVFSNQPLHAVLADGADAIVVVLVSPSSGPPRPAREFHLFEVVGRLTELANWRDLQTELRSLPAGWDPATSKGESGARRVCVVEPEGVLPGGLYGFRRENAIELMRRGELDARAALAHAGWLEPEAPAARDGAVAPDGATKARPTTPTAAITPAHP